MIDTHTHLHDAAFDPDRDDVVARAKESGISRFVTIGTDLEENRKAIECAKRYEGVFASVGIHPHEFSPGGKYEAGNDEAWQEELLLSAEDQRVLAIGECGLDYFSHDPEKEISSETKARQKEGFLLQKSISEKLKLPLVVHCRDAYADLAEILETAPHPFPVVLHCYMGDTMATDRFLKIPNVWFSFAANITYPVKKAFIGTERDTARVIDMIPLDRILTETDAPYLAPQKKRGMRNDSSSVADVVTEIARAKKREFDVVARTTEQNACKVFRFPMSMIE